MASTAKPELVLTSIGVDIGKDVFHIVGFDPDGRIVLRRKFKRLALVSEFERFPRCIAPVYRRYGSVPQRTLCQPGPARAGL